MAEVTIAGFEGVDTEALAVGPCAAGDPTSCVYVGDIGDNRAARPTVVLLRFPEPDLAAGAPPPVPAAVARFGYPDGPRDAEALLVDTAGTAHIVSKAAGTEAAGGSPPPEGGARLYRLDDFGDGTLTDLGPVPLPPPALAGAALVIGNLVTGADAAAGRVVLRTYDAAVEYVAQDPALPLATFPTWPAHEVPVAREPQGEAIAYALDGCGLLTASESSGDLSLSGCAPG